MFVHPDIREQINHIAQPALVEFGTSEILRENIFQSLILLLDRPHRIVYHLAYFGRVRLGRNPLPAGFGRDIEDIFGRIFVLVLLESFALGDKLPVFRFELIGNIFQENKPQHNGLVLRCVDIAAHLVRGLPYFPLKADIGFEREIWKAADKMRGNIDASEYKSVVLGLIFLKYISDKFETKYRQLVAEGEGFEEDKDEYTAENIFYVPTEARWERIAAEAHTPEIGQVIDNAMRAIEKENKRLKDILPKNFARPELDKRRLGDVVDLFTNIRMHEHGDSKDILGRAYEYCLSKFAEAEGKLAGEFYTPACIVKTLLMLLP